VSATFVHVQVTSLIQILLQTAVFTGAVEQPNGLPFNICMTSLRNSLGVLLLTRFIQSFDSMSQWRIVSHDDSIPSCLLRFQIIHSSGGICTIFQVF